MSDCKHCRNGWFSDQKFGQDVECVNGVLIDIDVAHDGWQRDVAYPLAPCHPEARKRLSRQKNDSQARLAAWATRDDPPDPRDTTIARLTAEMVEARATAFQARVDLWIRACFGGVIRGDKIERNHRFLEEALELVQSAGCTQSEAHQLVDYVFGRPTGDLPQEVGGVMNTLAAFCTAHGVDLAECGERELARVWTMVEKIRAKQAAKPKHSPLPEAARALAPKP